jgi:hypothetical protein
MRAAREKAGSDCKTKAANLNRIDEFSNRRKRLQRTTLNTFEISGLVLTYSSDSPIGMAVPRLFHLRKRLWQDNRHAGSIPVVRYPKSQH